MIHGLTTASLALLDRLSQTAQKHPKRITAAVAAVLLTGGGGAFAVASLGPDAADLPTKLVSYPVESLAENLSLEALDTFLREDRERWARVIKEHNIKVDQ